MIYLRILKISTKSTHTRGIKERSQEEMSLMNAINYKFDFRIKIIEDNQK